MKLTQAELDWIEQIKARAPKYVERGCTPIEAIQKAHYELQDFTGEMAIGESDRAKRAARVLSASVWRDCRNRDNNRRTIDTALSD